MAINLISYINNRATFLIFMSLIILASCTNIKTSKFTIKNESNETLYNVNVYVANKHFLIQEILPQISISKTFTSMDSHYKIIANVSSGKILKKEGHYVASGIAYDDIIFIDKQKIRIIASF